MSHHRNVNYNSRLPLITTTEHLEWLSAQVFAPSARVAVDDLIEWVTRTPDALAQFRQWSMAKRVAAMPAPPPVAPTAERQRPAQEGVYVDPRRTVPKAGAVDLNSLIDDLLAR